MRLRQRERCGYGDHARQQPKLRKHKPNQRQLDGGNVGSKDRVLLGEEDGRSRQIDKPPFVLGEDLVGTLAFR